MELKCQKRMSYFKEPTARVINSPRSRIHTLAIIAISQLLSPRHASYSTSLYSEYMSWMELYNIEHTGFKGFTANILGRIVEIAKEFLCRQQSIIDFFILLLM